MSVLVDDLKLFLTGREPFSDYLTDKQRTYTNSPDYLIYTLSFHGNRNVAKFEQAIAPPPKTSFIDVGCCAGTTGLNLALRGYHVTFHDYEGLGLEFIRWFADRHKLSCQVVPYGQDISKRFDIATAFDVLEHTGNHLSFIKWISGLARRVMICYPIMPFSPPFENVLDEWVDDEMIRHVVSSRYRLVYDDKPDGRRFLIWESD
jgi:hypothetical protein